MNDETMRRRAELLVAIYRYGACERRGPASDDLEALAAEGTLVVDGDSFALSEAGSDAMDAGVLAAATCVVSNNAMTIANLVSENARLKDLLRHVQSQPDGLRSCRCELTPKTLIITMPAGDEQAMIERVVKWAADEGAYLGDNGARLRNAETAARTMGCVAWQLKEALESIATAHDRDAWRMATATLRRLARYPSVLDAMQALRDQYVEMLPPDWSPDVTLADCAAWAEAIVAACEAEEASGRTAGGPYGDALTLLRSLQRGMLADHVSIETLRVFARESARSRDMWEARAWSAIVAVRMLAAEAMKKEEP